MRYIGRIARRKEISNKEFARRWGMLRNEQGRGTLFTHLKVSEDGITLEEFVGFTFDNLVSRCSAATLAELRICLSERWEETFTQLDWGRPGTGQVQAA